MNSAEPVRLVHPDLPDREIEVASPQQAVPLRKVGWVDAPPRPPAKSARKSMTTADAPADKKEES